MKKPIKKAQVGRSVKTTADSTEYFAKDASGKKDIAKMFSKYSPLEIEFRRAGEKSQASAERQKLKGKPGYDENGYPLNKFRPKSPKQQISEGVKKKMKSGGSVKAKKK